MSYMLLCPETGFVLQMASVEMASEEMSHQLLPHEAPPLGTQRLAGVLVVVRGGCCSPAPCRVPKDTSIAGSANISTLCHQEPVVGINKG